MDTAAPSTTSPLSTDQEVPLQPQDGRLAAPVISRSHRLFVVAAIAAAALLAAAFAAPAAVAQPAGVASAHNCGDLTFEYPNGGGGAYAGNIHTSGVGCSGALRVVRNCLHNRGTDGWHA